MKFWKPFPTNFQQPWPTLRLTGICISLIALTISPAIGKAVLQTNHQNVPEFLNRLPDANQQELMREQRRSQQDFEAANEARKKKVAEDSAKLIRLATDLKVEIDKAGKDTLSLAAIRKADEIEKLARAIKDRMKLTIQSN